MEKQNIAQYNVTTERRLTLRSAKDNAGADKAKAVNGIETEEAKANVKRARTSGSTSENVVTERRLTLRSAKDNAGADKAKAVNGIETEEAGDMSADITNLQRIMSSLEINIVPNTDSATISLPTSLARKLSLRRNSDQFSTSNLHKTNRRVIKKPKKNTKSNPTTENEIRKFYLNQNLSKLKSTLLETISENDEDATESANDQDDMSTQATLIGNRKIKRSLSFSTVPHTTKTQMQKRRKRIQTVLEGKSKTKKISMDMFMKRLKSLQDPNEKE